ncbi:hypothetical protein NUW54_g11746 [Trametes sanguinea]|uniref:Uncharacterized protein n=1 Tax=Trametes sanguinea TaxID=158606 RepID=A0ACC1N8U9_9APHY|nr:hypothetical protein NUW54_g11746 [Trametes sanguinea]
MSRRIQPLARRPTEEKAESESMMVVGDQARRTVGENLAGPEAPNIPRGNAGGSRALAVRRCEASRAVSALSSMTTGPAPLSRQITATLIFALWKVYFALGLMALIPGALGRSWTTSSFLFSQARIIIYVHRMTPHTNDSAANSVCVFDEDSASGFSNASTPFTGNAIIDCNTPLLPLKGLNVQEGDRSSSGESTNADQTSRCSRCSSCTVQRPTRQLEADHHQQRLQALQCYNVPLACDMSQHPPPPSFIPVPLTKRTVEVPPFLLPGHTVAFQPSGGGRALNLTIIEPFVPFTKSVALLVRSEQWGCDRPMVIKIFDPRFLDERLQMGCPKWRPPEWTLAAEAAANHYPDVRGDDLRLYQALDHLEGEELSDRLAFWEKYFRRALV